MRDGLAQRFGRSLGNFDVSPARPAERVDSNPLATLKPRSFWIFCPAGISATASVARIGCGFGTHSSLPRFPRSQDGLASRVSSESAATSATRSTRASHLHVATSWKPSPPKSHHSVWIALAAAKIVDSPLKRTELGKSQKISRVRRDHSDP